MDPQPEAYPEKANAYMTAHADHSIPSADWSFVIPCLNEEDSLARTIRSIHKWLPANIPYEVIVADHGSTDDSKVIAKVNGARVISVPNTSSLGSLRNTGAAAATGSVLLFLDADITLTAAWAENVLTVVQTLENTAPTLTGSMAAPPAAAGWIAQAWEHGRNRAGLIRSLSGGHMVILKTHFDEVGGFPDDADSGEDDALSARVWQAGGQVVANPGLHVIHWGASSTLREFFFRHFWHGLGDAKTLRSYIRSPTAAASTVFAMLYLTAVYALSTGRVLVAFTLATIAMALPAFLTWRRVRATWDLRALQLLLLFWVYLWARASAVVLSPFGLQRRRRRVTADVKYRSG